MVSDEMFKAAVHRFPDNTPRTKEAYWYRTIFEQHFPQRAAAETVPGGPSVACSTPTAALWDAAWAGNEDPSGECACRPVGGVLRGGWADGRPGHVHTALASAETHASGSCMEDWVE